MNQQYVRLAVYDDEAYEALAARCIGPNGRESLAVRQMIRDAITARGIDPTCVQLSDALITFQLEDETFQAQGEARALNFRFNTLTIVYGITAGVRAAGVAQNPDVWLFNIDRSQRNAIAQPDNQASFTGIATNAGDGHPSAIQPMYGEYKVDWTGSIQITEAAGYPHVVDRVTINLHGLELWQRNGPILGR